MEHRRIRWGVLGAGPMAQRFLADLRRLPDAEVTAIGSRSAARAEEVAVRMGIRRAHGSYDALVADPEVEVVYVSTPNSCHAEDARRVLEAGKALLLEKPFALGRAEAEGIFGLARARGVFAMEAMFTRFLPIMDVLVERVRAGAIGVVRALAADFGFHGDRLAEPRLFDPAFGGGSLRDVGVYPLALAWWLLGAPEEVAGLVAPGPTGVDEHAVVMLRQVGGALAALASAIDGDTPQQAWVAGTEARIVLDTPWWRSSGFTILRPEQAPERVERPFQGEGYQFEAAEVGRCLREGLLESPRWPAAATLSVLASIDRVLGQGPGA